MNHDLRFLLAHYPAAYQVDRTEGTNPIRQHWQISNEAGQLYGPIIYQKAPIVMRQLEMIVGARSLSRRAARVSQAVFVRQRDLARSRAHSRRRARRQNIAAWSRAWVEERGRPEFTTSVRLNDKRASGRRSRITHDRSAETRAGVAAADARGARLRRFRQAAAGRT